ncbi:MAG: cytidylyltransferase domain-containing protein [Planctomycetaceae bacterium]
MMKQRPLVIAVMPARAGSKGIPGKNSVMLGGRPILHYTLDEIAASRHVTHTVAITNDERFRVQAIAAGVTVIQEPEELAGDDVPIGLAIQFAVETCERQWGLRFDAVIQCEVTTPIRPPQIIDRCLELLWKSGAEVATTVEAASIYPPQWVVRRDPDGRVHFVSPNPPLHRQDMEPLFHLGGALAAFRRDVVGVPNYLKCDCVAVEYTNGECIYLDSPFDLLLAEFMLQHRWAMNESSGLANKMKSESDCATVER